MLTEYHLINWIWFTLSLRKKKKNFFLERKSYVFIYLLISDWFKVASKIKLNLTIILWIKSYLTKCVNFLLFLRKNKIVIPRSVWTESVSVEGFAKIGFVFRMSRDGSQIDHTVSKLAFVSVLASSIFLKKTRYYYITYNSIISTLVKSVLKCFLINRWSWLTILRD